VAVFGLLAATRGFSANYRWKIFWGTLCFLYGLFFFLRTTDVVQLHGHIFLPVSFLVFGVAFFMMYLNDMKEWFFLVPAVLLGGGGVLFILADMDYLSYWDVYDTVHTYWPVILILLGLGFIFRRRNTPPPPQNVAS
jgi:peptidoglycan/LPS O-acetylase OafA/YrhL